MKKSVLKKSIALVVGLLVLVASVVGALSASAADPDPYGTATDGITMGNNNWAWSGKIYSDITATEGLKNGDFAEGLKYWGPKHDWGSMAGAADGKASDYATVTDGTLVVDATTKYYGVRTVNFTLPYISAGDKPVVLVNFTHKITSEIKLFEVTNPVKASYADTALVSGTIGAYASATAPEVKVYGGSKAITSKDNYFYIMVQANEASTDANVLSLDDFYVAKDNGDGTYTDLSTGKKLTVVTGLSGSITPEAGTPGPGTGSEPIPTVADYGTTTDGMTQETKNSHYATITPTEGAMNLDFSEGLKYWGPKNDRTGKASDYASVTNGILTLKGAASYDGLRTNLFKLPYLEEGDKPLVLAKLFHKQTVAFQIYEVDPTAIGEGTRLTDSQAYAWGGQTADEVLALGGSNAVSSKDSLFYLQIQNNGVVAASGDVTIDTVIIVKKNADDTYTDLSTGKKYTTTKTSIDRAPEEGEDPAWAGTEEGGVTQYYYNSQNGIYMGEFTIGSFDKGLKYWCSKTQQLPSDFAELKTTADGNKYCYFKGSASGSNYYGWRTARFSIPGNQISVGDQFVILFDYKSEEDANCLQICLEEIEGEGVRLTQTFKGDLVIGNEWCTGYVGANGDKALIARSVDNNDPDDSSYLFRMLVECKAAENTISLDNIRICKLVGNKIVALDGTVVHEDVNTTIDKTAGTGGGAGTGNGNGGSSATTGESFPVAPIAVAGLVFACAVVILKKKVR